MRHAARVDANQQQIVSALRAAGAYVWIIGLPVDLLVGYRNHTWLMEIKTNESKKLTKLQKDFFENWQGGTLCRVDNAEAALRAIGAIVSFEDLLKD
jgi:hypothetical protein